MKRFKNILYYAEGEERPSPALLRAVALAKRNQAQLTLMDVMENPSRSSLKGWLVDVDVKGLIAEQRQEQLTALAKPFADTGLSIRTEVRFGNPFMEIIRTVLRAGHDLIIKTARPPRGTAEQLFGSSDLHLLRKCPCPVWIDKPTKKESYERIMAAVDASDDNLLELNRLILDLATSLAAIEKSEVHVLHAWRLPGESLLRYGRANLPKQQVDELADLTHNEHRRKLDFLLEPYDLSTNAQVHLVQGWPAEVIARCAADQNINLLVMGTIGRIGLPGFFIGNTAEDVLNVVRCSVLAVKPRGFQSPVKL